MKDQYKYILDMDGTLYQFDKGQGKNFTSSRFYNDLRQNVYRFFVETRSISLEQAILEYESIKQKYDGEVSLGVEREYGINRYDYFNRTWNMNPADYIERDDRLVDELEPLRNDVALLTSAPRIWAINVLSYLNINRLFNDNIYTGEPDVRKPNPLIFQRIASDLKVPPEKVFSVGDQETTDIIPARSIGMKTILVGSSRDSVADYQVDNIVAAVNVLKNGGFV